jgi:hypothetical protein
MNRLGKSFQWERWPFLALSGLLRDRFALDASIRGRRSGVDTRPIRSSFSQTNENDAVFTRSLTNRLHRVGEALGAVVIVSRSMVADTTDISLSGFARGIDGWTVTVAIA